MNFIEYLFIFVIIYLLYFIFVIMRKKALLKFQTSTYALYLKNVYKVKIEQMNPYILANEISLTNSFVLATSIYYVLNIESIIKNEFLFVLASFVGVMILLFGVYHILGIILKKKGDKNV